MSCRVIPLSMALAACAGSDASHGATFTVWLFDERATLDGTETPIANVAVALDGPDGLRVVKSTEADGHVTFEGDFARGVSITALSDNHVYVTMLEASPEAAAARPNRVGKPATDLVIFPPRLDRLAESMTVGLRGTIAGKQGVDNAVTLALSGVERLGAVRTLEPTYLLRAPRDRPFFLLGHETRVAADAAGILFNEHLKSFRIDLAARSDDELMDLDLPKLPALPTRRIRMRVEPPRQGPVPFGAGTGAVASVTSADSELAVGLFAEAKATPNGALDVDVHLVDADVAPERLLSHVVVTAPDGSKSARTEQATLTDGAVWKDFAAPPTIREPEASRTARDAIPLDGFPAGADLFATVYAGGSLLWILHGPPGGPRARSFTLPYHDEVKVPEIRVFALSLAARFDRVELPMRGEFYRYTSTFRDIILRKR
ncbi:MAG: hypothetical protein IPG50_05450 [Myxococcales bacterium]|nr:hypothetical protein [Myxococcales bacterium]